MAEQEIKPRDVIRLFTLWLEEKAQILIFVTQADTIQRPHMLVRRFVVFS